jgi:predicted Na+-dependent transporter
MTPPRAKKAWLAYAGLLTAAVLIGELSNFLRGEPFSWLNVANWVVTLALLTATWGYALQRPIGHASYWRRVFWILLTASALMLLRVALVSSAVFVVVLGFMAVLIPAYVAAYRYAFRSSDLWQGKHEDAAGL